MKNVFIAIIVAIRTTCPVYLTYFVRAVPEKLLLVIASTNRLLVNIEVKATKLTKQ